MSEQYSTPSAEAMRLRKQLLGIVLRDTLRKTGVPPDWLTASTQVSAEPGHNFRFELLLALNCDEPRFLTYLTAFQAEFERGLLSIESGAGEWFTGFTWRLQGDPVFQSPMPPADYWQSVNSDREITARQNGALEWDRETLRHHFLETTPSELTPHFVHDARTPARGLEDIAEKR